MVDVVHRTTREHRRSVNDPEYPAQDWIHNPDLSAVIGFDSKYWLIAGDVISLMAPAQRQAVDDAELAAKRDSIADTIQTDQQYERAFAEVLLDELNAHATRMNAIMGTFDANTTFATVRTAMLAIADYPQRTLAQLRTAMRNKLDG